MEKYRLVAFIVSPLKDGPSTRYASKDEQGHEDFQVRLCKITTGDIIDHVETVPAFLYGTPDEAIEYWGELNQAIIEPVVYAEDLRSSNLEQVSNILKRIENMLVKKQA